MYRFFIITLLAIIALRATTVEAQIITRRVSYDTVKINQILADRRLFQEQYPMLQNLPPVSSGMPADVIAGYLYSDSLFKYGNEDSCYWNNLKLQTDWINDTLKTFAKYIYLMQDYNPIIFKQYFDEANNSDLFPSGGCNSVAPYICSYMGSKDQDGNRKALKIIFRSDYILKVRINSILDSGTTHLSKHKHWIYKASARVLDSLKGQVFKTCTPQPKSLNSITDNKPIDNINYPDICFEFSHWYHADDGDISIRDSALTGKKEFLLIPGQEYIIFLDIGSRIRDLQNDYYDLYTIFPFAISIINGQVRDYDHIWGTTTWVDYQIWKQKFLNIKQRILKGEF